MPIVYIHGVRVRSPDHGKALREPFLRWLGPALAGSDTLYLPVFWGDRGADFRWNLESRPKTAILGMGGSDTAAGLAAAASAPLAAVRRSTGEAAGAADGPVLGGEPAPDATRTGGNYLRALKPSQRADTLVDLYLAARPRTAGADPLAEDVSLAPIADAAQEVADHWDEITAGRRGDDAAAEALLAALDERLHRNDLLAAGGADWLTKAGELLKRAAAVPGDVISTTLAEGRPALNEFVANFFGDVLTYQATRLADGRPGEIPQRVITALKTAAARKAQTGERIIVVTHSMGGQLLYDVLTFFADQDPDLKDVTVDHWISCGAQVSFFCELRLFLGQPDRRAPYKLPRPARALKWTNYYDTNDTVGFIMGPVFEGVRDQAYDTGYGLALAHTGFLARPSFFAAVGREIAP